MNIPLLPISRLDLFNSFARTQDIPYGVVSFSKCLLESKYGKQEQEAFENIKNQMTLLLSDVEKQWNEIAAKLQNPEFIDSLSPEAEQELNANAQEIREKQEHYQNQYAQTMQQSNIKLIQAMNNQIAKAAQVLAKRDHLSLIIREEACIVYSPSCDITRDIIEEMDKHFNKNNPKQDK